MTHFSRTDFFGQMKIKENFKKKLRKSWYDKQAVNCGQIEFTGKTGEKL